MTWTPWIETEPPDTSQTAVRELYHQTRNLSTGIPPDVVRLHSLTPEISGMIYRLNRTIHEHAKGLTLREQGIAALVVAAFNG